MKAKGLGVYIHIPFCIRKCNYCDFCSFPNSSPKIMERYADELCRRIRDFSHRAHDRVVDTVYFGGGTPTLLPIPCFEKLMEALKNSFTISPDAEISCECNPASIDKNGLIALFWFTQCLVRFNFNEFAYLSKKLRSLKFFKKM